MDIELPPISVEDRHAFKMRGSDQIAPQMPSFDISSSVEAGTTPQRWRPGDPVKMSDDQGYPKLAIPMGIYPENAIFRRFGWLSTLNLMRLQAELAQLEEDLKGCQREDESVVPRHERNSPSPNKS